MTTILFISPPILKGSGGEVIRKRNKDFLEQYVGKENLYHFYLDYYALYPGALTFERQCQIVDDLKAVINQIKPTLIYLDNSLMAVPDFVYDYKTLVFFHNIETNYALQDKNLSKEMVELITKNEAKIVKKASKLICINQRDSNELSRLFKRSADYILPISFKDKFSQEVVTKKGEYLLFVGSNFYGNTDGLFWFIENCLASINQKLIVVGKGMERYNGKYPNQKVSFLGYVEDLAILYGNASCVILPIISGSGMKTKTCEAFMYGKKCFGTPEAYEGYTNIDEARATICQNEIDFIDSINSYLNKSNTSYLKEARDYFLNYYENSIVQDKYHTFLKEVIKD